MTTAQSWTELLGGTKRNASPPAELLIAPGDRVLLCARPRTGLSTLALHLAIALHRDGSFLGFLKLPAPARVCLVDGDPDPDRLRRRLWATPAGKQLANNSDLPLLLPLGGESLSIQQLFDVISQRDLAVVVLDLAVDVKEIALLQRRCIEELDRPVTVVLLAPGPGLLDWVDVALHLRRLGKVLLALSFLKPAGRPSILVKFAKGNDGVRLEVGR